MAETIGSIQVVATINTKDYDAAKKSIEKGNAELDKNAASTSKSFSSAWTGAIAGVAAALTTKFLGAITSSVDGAIKRVDTLNNSNRTFENMGIGATESGKAMDALQKSIKGLPTPLDGAVRGMTSLTATYGDIDKGQKVFSALNNAILGFGGTAFMVENAITQLSQLPLDGPLDAQTWNSLRNSGITPVLSAMAKDSNVSVSQLKEAFGSGELSVQDFIDRLLKLNTEGGGGLASLETIAQDSTKGIGTGMANLTTAITRGMASIIESIGSDNISAIITGIGTAIENSLKNVVGIIEFVAKNIDVFTTLASGIAAASGAMLIYSGYVKVAAVYQAAMNAASILYSAYTSAVSAGLGKATAAQIAFNVATKANPIGIIVTAIIALVGALIWFFTQTQLGKEIVQNVFNFIKSVFETVPKVINSAINTVVKVFQDMQKNVTNVLAKIGYFLIGVADTVKDVVNNIKKFFVGLGKSIADIFNGIVGFFKRWGLTILAVIFWPFSLALGLIIKNWAGITAFFQSVWNGIVAVFNTVVNFFRTVFSAAWQAIVTIFTPIVTFFSNVFQAAWNIIRTIWGNVVAFYKSVWDGIVAVFSVVATFFIGVFTTALNGILTVWSRMAGFFSDTWAKVAAVFSVVGKFFYNVFSQAWSSITSIFSAVGSWFKQNVWDPIVALFKSVGTAVGNAIGSTFKNVINSVLRGAVSMINGFIDAINGAVDIINNIPGVSIGKIGTLPVPQLAKGGVISARPGGMLANIGEGRHDEAVIPLDNRFYESLGSDEPTIENNIGTINLGNDVDVDSFFNRLTRDTEIFSKSIVPKREFN